MNEGVKKRMDFLLVGPGLVSAGQKLTNDMW